MRISDWSADVCSSDLKPLDIDELGLIVSRAFHVHALEKENLRLANMGAEDNRVLGRMLTGAPEMLTVARTIERVANGDVSVMLLGASGTGKALLAGGVHDISSRRKGQNRKTGREGK